MMSKQKCSDICSCLHQSEVGFKYSKFCHNYRRIYFSRLFKLHQQLNIKSRKTHHSNLECKFSCIELFNLSLPIWILPPHTPLSKCSQFGKHCVQEIIHLFLVAAIEMKESCWELSSFVYIDRNSYGKCQGGHFAFIW